MTKKKKILLAGIILLLLTGMASSSSIFINIGLQDACTQLIRMWLRCWMVFHTIQGDFMENYAYSFPLNLHIILENPDPGNPAVLNLTRFFVNVLLPLYVIAIIADGFYLLMVSTSIEGREKAKSLFVRLVMSMVVLSLSTHLITLLLSLSRELTESIFSMTSPIEIRGVLQSASQYVFWVFARLTPIDNELGIIFHMLLFVLAILPYISILLRYILLTLLVILFPVSIFLYSVPVLQGIGRKMLEQTLVWTFLQVMFALVIVVFAGIGIHVQDEFIVDKSISISGLRWELHAFGDSIMALMGLEYVLTLKLFYGGPFGWLAAAGIVAGVGAAGALITEGMMAGLPLGLSVSITSFVLGVIIYLMITVLPLIMVRWFSDFLP